mmetsp:Transcript_35979/g.78165  ORF Transcript_35979/g.78165 Transcript_35979/m.78165 type:complete len:229 (+) Transcript_35979:1397-2083(+)
MSAPASSAATLLRTLCRSNTALCTQKVGLLDALLDRHGTPAAAADAFTSVCPIVGASIGQHFRHSMDHMELIALVSAAKCTSAAAPDAASTAAPAEIHYDLRVRGGTLEKDMDEARNRIVSVVGVLDEVTAALSEAKNDDEEEELASFIANSPVNAQFFLTADENEESKLPSTVARELGFAAHHAIHHLAMVRVIALETAGLSEADLPDHFGRAPSTIKHDREGERKS